MATYYVKYRKTGPTAVYSIIANSREAAIALVQGSAAAGEEFEVWDANTYGFNIISTTGPTGATG